MFYVYVIRSNKDNKLYIGCTNNLKRRFAEHNSGQSKATKGRRPFELVYYEAYKAKQDAVHREKMLKLRATALGQLKRRLKNSLFPESVGEESPGFTGQDAS
jgi:putative endonuclease